MGETDLQQRILANDLCGLKQGTNAAPIGAIALMRAQYSQSLWHSCCRLVAPRASFGEPLVVRRLPAAKLSFAWMTASIAVVMPRADAIDFNASESLMSACSFQAVWSVLAVGIRCLHPAVVCHVGPVVPGCLAPFAGDCERSRRYRNLARKVPATAYLHRRSKAYLHSQAPPWTADSSSPSLRGPHCGVERSNHVATLVG
jgi:hypothetical protein